MPEEHQAIFMTEALHCPHCSHKHKIQQEMLLRTVREELVEGESYEIGYHCKDCGKKFTVHIFYELEPNISILVSK